MKRAVCTSSQTSTPEQSTPWSVSQDRYSAKSAPDRADEQRGVTEHTQREGDVAGHVHRA